MSNDVQFQIGIKYECVWNVWNELFEKVLFTLIEALWCEIVGIVMLYVKKDDGTHKQRCRLNWFLNQII